MGNAPPPGSGGHPLVGSDRDEHIGWLTGSARANDDAVLTCGASVVSSVLLGLAGHQAGYAAAARRGPPTREQVALRVV